MNQHSTDLAALVFGVAFTIAGAVIMLAESTSVDVGPLWGCAIVSIAVGFVTLLVTIARSRRDPVEAPLGPERLVSAAGDEPGDGVVDG
jgi:hypothetical protein